MDNIKLLILISGKRNTGKDYIGLILQNYFSLYFSIEIIFLHATDELKREFALNRGLDLNQLLTDRNYKEKYREEMTLFANKRIEQNGKSYYNRLLYENHFVKTKILTIYVVDVRYKFEIEYYLSLKIPISTIRIEVDDEIKNKRGWIYDSKIDNDPSEIDLDDYNKWDLIFNNDIDGDSKIKEFFVDFIKSRI